MSLCPLCRPEWAGLPQTAMFLRLQRAGRRTQQRRSHHRTHQSARHPVPVESPKTALLNRCVRIEIMMCVCVCVCVSFLPDTRQQQLEVPMHGCTNIGWKCLAHLPIGASDSWASHSHIHPQQCPDNCGVWCPISRHHNTTTKWSNGTIGKQCTSVQWRWRCQEYYV